MEEMKHISKIEVQILESEHCISRIVYKDGKLKYKDQWDTRIEHPDYCDPIHRLELFLKNEEPQCINGGCRYAMYRVYPRKSMFESILKDDSTKGRIIKAIIYFLLTGVLPTALVWLAFFLF